MSFNKAIAIAISNDYTIIFFSLPRVNNLGFFDKIVLMKNGFWILPVGTGLLILPMKIRLLILLVGTRLLILQMKIRLLILSMGIGLLILPIEIGLFFLSNTLPWV